MKLLLFLQPMSSLPLWGRVRVGAADNSSAGLEFCRVAVQVMVWKEVYYLARGVRRLWRAPFEKPAAVVLSVLLAVPSVLSFLFIAMIPAELSQYKDGFWLLFSWIVFFLFFI